MLYSAFWYYCWQCYMSLRKINANAKLVALLFLLALFLRITLYLVLLSCGNCPPQFLSSLCFLFFALCFYTSSNSFPLFYTPLFFSIVTTHRVFDLHPIPLLLLFSTYQWPFTECFLEINT